MTLTIPHEGVYSQEELRWLESEPANIFPYQASLFGQQRKVLADYVQTNLVDVKDQLWLNLDPATCDEDDIANWEVMLGIPVDPTKTLQYRRLFIQLRSYRGAFTRTLRRQIVELFVAATFGEAISFTLAGIPFTSDGIPFFSGEFSLDGTYEIVEDIPNYAYAVYLLDGVDVDIDAMLRELKRVTPSPIDDGITVQFVSVLP